MPQPAIFVSIFGPDQIIFEQYATSVTSVNDSGVFDILPLHSHFITLIKDKIIVKDQNNLKKEFKIDQGVLKVYNDQVSIFLGINGLAT